MTIQESAYHLAKSVMKSECRGDIQALIRDLNRATKEGDRSTFGYHARRLHAQALGYLLVNENVNKLPFKVKGLERPEIDLLQSFHQELAWLNRECLNAAFSGFAVPALAANPYASFRFPPVDKEPEWQFMGAEARANLVDAFAKHPCVRLAQETQPDGIEKVSIQQYQAALVRIGQSLQAAGVHDAPDDVVKLALQVDPGSVESTMFRHTTAMAALRASLGAVDQLLFQAAMNDKLPTATNDNVINVVQQNRSVIGEGLTLLCVWNETLGHVEPADLMLVVDEILGKGGSDLAMVHGLKVSFSNEAGTTSELSLRILDENLNPFSGLTGKN